MIWILLLALQQATPPKPPSIFDKPEFAEGKFEANVDSGAHASASSAVMPSVPPVALLGLAVSRPSSSANPAAREDHDHALRLEAQGDSVAAAPLFARAAERDPSPEHLVDAAVHLLAHGAPKRAIPFLERGLKADPDHTGLRLALGLSQFALGRYEQAKDTFLTTPDIRALEGLVLIIESVPALAPSLVEPMSRSPYHQALALLRSPGANPATRRRAESLLLRAINENPKLDKARFELARLYLDDQRNAEAEQALLGTVQANPNHELAHFRLAQLYQRSDRKPQADVHFAAYRRLHTRRLATEESERKRRVLFVETNP